MKCHKKACKKLDNLTSFVYLIYMKFVKTLQVGELKANFSKIIEKVKGGEEITIAYGRKNEKVAVIVPYEKYMGKKTRKLGLLEKTASCKFTDGFSISDEELLHS